MFILRVCLRVYKQVVWVECYLFLMEFWSELQSYESLRHLLELASARTSSCWRFLFGSTLASVVYRAKEEYSDQFASLLAHNPGIFASLNLGHHSFFNEIVIRNLDFSSPGRTVSGLAFICYLLDKWSAQTQLSGGYTLDYMTMALWRTLLRRRRVLDSSRALHPRGLSPVREEDEENPRAGLDPPTE